jgi:hypothetical protein
MPDFCVCAGESNRKVQGDQAHRGHLDVGHHHEDPKGLQPVHHAEPDTWIQPQRPWRELCQGDLFVHEKLLQKTRERMKTLNCAILF